MFGLLDNPSRAAITSTKSLLVESFPGSLDYPFDVVFGLFSRLFVTNGEPSLIILASFTPFAIDMI